MTDVRPYYVIGAAIIALLLFIAILPSHPKETLCYFRMASGLKLIPSTKANAHYACEGVDDRDTYYTAYGCRLTSGESDVVLKFNIMKEQSHDRHG